MFAAALTLALSFQGPPPDGDRTEKPQPAAEATQPLPAELSKSEAREITRAFKKGFKPRKGLSTQMKAVEMLGKGRHESLVKPLCQVLLTTDHATVRNRAAEILVLQPDEEAREAILRMLEQEAIEEAPPAAKRLVEGLERVGVTEPTKRGLRLRARSWKMLSDLFEACDYAPEAVGLQKAMFRLAARDKAVEFVEVLVANIDEPVPADPHSPTNPPASYWERRWKAWQSWREDAKKALYTITGHRFSAAKEADIWLDRNRRRLERDLMEERIAKLPEDG